MLRMTYYNNDQRGDLDREGGQNLVEGDDLETAVLLSIFTDARDDQASDGYRGGWWGSDNVPIGSRLWLLKRAKATQNNVNLAKDYILESLNWMLVDKVASKISVETSRGNGPVDLNFKIDISRPDGKTWSRAWELQLHEL